MSSKHTSKADVDVLARLVSLGLKGDLHVVAEGRYGYTAIDLYDSHGCVRTLATGMTKRQALDYLRAMYETLTIAGRFDDEGVVA